MLTGAKRETGIGYLAEIEATLIENKEKLSSSKRRYSDNDT